MTLGENVGSSVITSIQISYRMLVMGEVVAMGRWGIWKCL